MRCFQGGAEVTDHSPHSISTTANRDYQSPTLVKMIPHSMCSLKDSQQINGTGLKLNQKLRKSININFSLQIINSFIFTPMYLQCLILSVFGQK